MCIWHRRRRSRWCRCQLSTRALLFLIIIYELWNHYYSVAEEASGGGAGEQNHRNRSSAAVECDVTRATKDCMRGTLKNSIQWQHCGSLEGGSTVNDFFSSLTTRYLSLIPLRSRSHCCRHQPPPMTTRKGAAAIEFSHYHSALFGGVEVSRLKITP